MDILMALFPLIALIVVGFALKRTEFLSEGFWGNSEKLNYYILFPVLLFLNISKVELNLETVSSLLTVLIVVTLVVAVFLWILKRIYHIPTERFGVYVQSQLRFNTYIGLSLLAMLFGSPGMQMFSMVIAVAIPLVNIISVLSFSTVSIATLRKTFIAIIKNPLILACIVGVLFNVLNINLFLGLDNLLKLFAAMSLPLGLLSVGAALQFNQIKTDITRLSINVFARLLFMPLFTYAICLLFGLTQFETTVLITYFALPTASASYILTKVYQGDDRLMAAVISLQTIFFILTYPLLMEILF
ncbi:transporter [Acinetobacter sp. ANC 4558]|uniref:AEC family transporter n=1 Tax=Acinetobacter sp. ANC 4558 TaxID=1977876 RepID=UPI000A32DE39|nr:AEC family transporter [Acinetobacter sp. ANC 4558]OTG86942.1 transporter [Acinetobacter sp. ANC 4558]